MITYTDEQGESEMLFEDCLAMRDKVDIPAYLASLGLSIDSGDIPLTRMTESAGEDTEL